VTLPGGRPQQASIYKRLKNMRKISSLAGALQGLENKVLTAIKFPRTGDPDIHVAPLCLQK
jgi:hypothetical protein